MLFMYWFRKCFNALLPYNPEGGKMSILSDKDLVNAIEKGQLKIRGFKEENLTPNGYDLTIEEIQVNRSKTRVSEGRVLVPPLSNFVISTKEFVEFGPHLTGQLWIRSSWARKGVLASFGKIDSGFKGTLTLAGFNASPVDLEISVGDTFAQMVLEEVSSEPENLYEERSGHYQGQRGINLKKP
ncbi:MAG: dCTP deaminase [Methanomassiliicoccales archaeon]|nr:MAG: dCTP deaminase [Methanomassiliicoccales archaeon]